MTDEEMVEALLKGAILRISKSGETTIQGPGRPSPKDPRVHRRKHQT